MGTSKKTKIAFVTVLLVALAGSLAHATDYCGVYDPCPTTEDGKWFQPPDKTWKGVDVKATLPKVLADDFLCENAGPITDIRIWGSWLRDVLPGGSPGNITFGLGIFSDIPATDCPPSYSRPGELLWGQVFRPGDFDVSLHATVMAEGWYDPPGDFHYSVDRKIWQYDFHIDPEAAFLQEGTSEEPVVYWLGVTAVVADPGDDGRRDGGGDCPPPDPQFGWKTSCEHWNDDAVWADVDLRGLDGLTDGVAIPDAGQVSWNELRYPWGHPYYGQSMDLSFALVPEPATMALFALGFIPLFIRRRSATLGKARQA